MPQYLEPGVHVEETTFRSRSIEGVGTSVAALVGPLPTGPVRGRPELLTSYADFERMFGGAGDLTFGAGDAATTVPNHTALAARAFYENGGRQLYVARVFAGVNATDADGEGGSATVASAASADGRARFEARFPGGGGDLTLRIFWGDPLSLLRTRTLTEIADGETALVRITGEIAGADLTAAGGHGGFPLAALTVLATREGDALTFAPNTRARVVNADDSEAVVPVADLGSGVPLANLAGDTVVYARVGAAAPASGPLEGETPAELVLSRAADVSDFVPGGVHWGDARVLRGWIAADGASFFVANQPINPGVDETTTVEGEARAGYLISLSALAAEPGAARALRIQRSAQIDVLRGGEPVFSFPLAHLAPDAAAGEIGLAEAMPADPERRQQALTQPVSATVTAGSTAGQVHAALLEMMRATNGDALTPPDGLGDPQYLITLAGGSDGEAPEATDYGGETNEQLGSTGFAALEEVEEISIVMAPASAADATHHRAVSTQIESHVNRMRYRIGLVDPLRDWAVSEVRAFRGNFNNSRLALYYPWVVTVDPTGARDSVAAPPSGSIAGVMARTDAQRGVHKAPANTPVTGALRFRQEINGVQQEILNPLGVNALRSFPGRGHLVWGARTMTDDPEWRYVNVRRYFLYLERSIDRGLQWAVFEPNGEALWANVRTTISDFLFAEFTSGRLLGASPREAYFVRCDRSTMTQADIDAGRLIALVGVAPLRPAEFVVIRIGQIVTPAAAQ